MPDKQATIKKKQVMDRWILPGFGLDRLLLWGSAAVLAGYVAVQTPFAPWSTVRADLAYAEGRTHDAVRLYDALAGVNPDPAIRLKAMRRTAKIVGTQLGDFGEARYRWRSVLGMGVSIKEQAQIWETISDLHWAERANVMDKDEKAKRASWAVRALLRAANVDKASKEAPRRMLRAALLLQSSGQQRKAIAQYKRLARTYPDLAPRVNLELAQIKLSAGNEEQALGLFESAEEDPELAMVARMGSATCLERLGSLDEALAELDVLDDLDEMEGMMGSRIERIRKRQ